MHRCVAASSTATPTTAPVKSGIQYKTDVNHQMDRDQKPIDLIQSLKNFVIHLRLKFNLILIPLFCFGYFFIIHANSNLRTDPFRLFVSEGTDFRGSTFWLQFIILHVCMYGGANSLNSYYDKDEGPIGGLKNPPPVNATTLILSWIGKQPLSFPPPHSDYQ